MDRTSREFGSTERLTVLAKSSAFSQHYHIALEEVQAMGPSLAGPTSAKLRAEMAWYEPKEGAGAVFAASSLSWAGGLTDTSSDVSRITLNVLRRMLAS